MEAHTVRRTRGGEGVGRRETVGVNLRRRRMRRMCRGVAMTKN